MKLTVLGSGSTGNAVLIVAGETRVLVDAGLSAKELARRLAMERYSARPRSTGACSSRGMALTPPGRRLT